MGIYLNSRKPHDNYMETASGTYFVDKTRLLEELIPLAEDPAEILGRAEFPKAYMPGRTGLLKADLPGKSNKYICITRPRRFGKTVMANMIASFFGKGGDSRQLFEALAIGGHPRFERHVNAHDVIFLSLNESPKNCNSYQQYIDYIQNRLLRDLDRAFPETGIQEEDSVWDALDAIYELKDGKKFVFVLDEWDYIFHRDYVTEKDCKAYVVFLSNLLKDKAYVRLAYMTGILPIAKYSSGSELNMFAEYTMATEEKYSSFFGFTDEEVDALFAAYQKQPMTSPQKVTREGLRLWYDGYHTKSGIRVYNPRSVVFALTNNNLGNYWTSAGPYDELFFYIEKNVHAVREDLALMVSGTPVRANVQEYATSSMSLSSRDEIFSAMVVYGFLNYDRGCVSIPNKELMDRFEDVVKKEPSLGYVNRLASESLRMLYATLHQDTDTMEKILSFAHDTESPLLQYNHEAELTMIVNMVYLSARDSYRIEREDKAGTGYVDFIFYPRRPEDDGIILELKVDDTPENALLQIHKKNYALAFAGKTGEPSPYTGRILAVGIGYGKKSKLHKCRVEELRGRL